MKSQEIFEKQIGQYISSRLSMYFMKEGSVPEFLTKLIAVPYKSVLKKPINKFDFHQEQFEDASKECKKLENFLSCKSFDVGIQQISFDKNLKPVWMFMITWIDTTKYEEYMKFNFLLNFTVTVSDNTNKVNFFKEDFRKKIPQTSSIWTDFIKEIKQLEDSAQTL